VTVVFAGCISVACGACCTQPNLHVEVLGGIGEVTDTMSSQCSIAVPVCSRKLGRFPCHLSNVRASRTLLWKHHCYDAACGCIFGQKTHQRQLDWHLPSHHSCMFPSH